MTTVTFLTEESRIIGFDAKGHSGYAEEGEDIVCAAVTSAVFHTSGMPVVMRHSHRVTPRRMRHSSRSTRAVREPRMTVPALHWAAKTHLSLIHI